MEKRTFPSSSRIRAPDRSVVATLPRIARSHKSVLITVSITSTGTSFQVGTMVFSLRCRDMTSSALSWRIYNSVSSWDYLPFNATLQWIWSGL